MVKQSKWNDRFRHKDVAIKLHERKQTRRSRYDARASSLIEANEALAEQKLDRVIDSLCSEAGI